MLYRKHESRAALSRPLLADGLGLVGQSDRYAMPRQRGLQRRVHGVLVRKGNLRIAESQGHRG